MQQEPHPLLGPVTCNVGTISGGVQVNFVSGEEVEAVLAFYTQIARRFA